jgi:hypothetical protein
VACCEARCHPSSSLSSPVARRRQAVADVTMSRCRHRRSHRAATVALCATAAALLPSCRQCCTVALPPPPRRRQAAADVAMSRCLHRRSHRAATCHLRCRRPSRAAAKLPLMSRCRVVATAAATALLPPRCHRRAVRRRRRAAAKLPPTS